MQKTRLDEEKRQWYILEFERVGALSNSWRSNWCLKPVLATENLNKEEEEEEEEEEQEQEESGLPSPCFRSYLTVTEVSSVWVAVVRSTASERIRERNVEIHWQNNRIEQNAHNGSEDVEPDCGNQNLSQQDSNRILSCIFILELKWHLNENKLWWWRQSRINDAIITIVDFYSAQLQSP